MTAVSICCFSSESCSAWAVCDVVLQEVVARAEIAERDRRLLEMRELVAERVLARDARRRSGRAPPATSCSHLGVQLAADLGLLARASSTMLRGSGRAGRRARRARACRSSSAQVQLLDAGLVEEVGERRRVSGASGTRSGSASVTRVPSALVSRLESSPICCPTTFCSWLTATFGCSVAKRRSAVCARSTLAARLAQLVVEELPAVASVREPRLLVGLDVGLGVRRGEDRRERGLGVVKRTSIRSVPRTSRTSS